MKRLSMAVLGVVSLVLACGGVTELNGGSKSRNSDEYEPESGGAGGENGNVTNGGSGAGGDAGEEVTKGAVRYGLGLYELVILPGEDDCDPPFPTGDMGPVVVNVTKSESGAANVTAPQCEGLDRSCNWVISTYQSDFPVSSGNNPMVEWDWSQCPARMSIDYRLTSLSADAIDVQAVMWFDGLAEPCIAKTERLYPELTRDCRSTRVYRYEWLHSCAEGSTAEAGSDPSTCL